MPRKPRTPAERAADMVGRMPHVPPFVAERMVESYVAEGSIPRGTSAAVERFFTHLETVGRPYEMVTADDFAAVTSSRTGFRTLLSALRDYAPEIPLAAATDLRRDWDRWLNATYGKKPPKPRTSTRIALLPENWPPAFREAIALLDRVVRIDGERFRRLKPKTRGAVLQSTGMMWAARNWAAARGVDIPPALSPDLVEVFTRFLLDPDRSGRKDKGPIRARSAADYLERARAFAARAGLLDAETAEVFAEVINALAALADDQEPTKRKKLRNFRRDFTLASLVRLAMEKAEEAEAYPAHTEAAIRLRREAMILALLANTGDRQGDLSTHVIGRTIIRNPDGVWEPAFSQRKTGKGKENGPLWRITSDLIDLHLLGDRPSWAIEDRVAALEGKNLVSLADKGMGLYYPSAILEREFKISGHIVRTLITDAIRVHRPDAAWAAQFMLGHSSRWMQATYRDDFRETAVMRDYHAALDELMGQDGTPAGGL